MSQKDFPTVGGLLDERYRLLREIGRGGMGVVYLAEDQKLGRRVAVKIPGRESRQMVKRFRREFTTGAIFEHPNIIRIFDFGITSSGMDYYTMEFIDGLSLEQLIKREKRLDEHLVHHLVWQLLQALALLHENAVIHRDLKPGNILLRSDPSEANSLLLTDFGLIRDLKLTALTETGLAIGTPYVMSPEQIMGQRVDARSDLFAVGGLTYWMLAGKSPFSAVDIGDVLEAIEECSYESIDKAASELRYEWQPFFEQTLVRNPLHRSPSAKELLDVLPDLSGSGWANGVRAKKIMLEPSGSTSEAIPDGFRNGDNLEYCYGQEKKKRLIKFGLLFAAAVLLLFALISTLMDSSPYRYRVIDLTVEPSLEGAIVSWLSTRAYPTRIVLIDEEKREVFGSGERSKEHSIALTDLSPDKEYEFQVSFPDGSCSLSRRFSPKALKLALHSGVFEDDQIELRLKVMPQLDCRVQSEEGVADGEVTTDGVFVFELSPALWGEDACVLVEEEGEVFARRTLAGIASEAAEKYESSFSNFEPRSLIRDLVTKMRADMKRLTRYITKADFEAKRSDEPSARVRKKVAEIFERRFNNCKTAPLWRAFCAQAPVFFRSKYLSFAEKSKLYSSLRGMLRLNCAAKFIKITPSIPVPSMYCWNLSAEPLDGSATVRCIEDSAFSLRIKVPFFSGLEASEWQGNFFIKSLKGVERAELQFSVYRYNRKALRVQVNELPALIMPDLTNDFGYDLPKRHKLYQRIPVEGLHTGRNEIRVKLEPLLGVSSLAPVMVHSVSLRLLR